MTECLHAHYQHFLWHRHPNVLELHQQALLEDWALCEQLQQPKPIKPLA